MLDDFLVRAAIAAIGVSLAAGPLGCFVVWRRMAYFGDATAHAAILGVALALAFEVSIFAGVLVVALITATIVATLSGPKRSSDTLLGVIAHSSLAFGLVAISFLPNVRVDLSAYLFGDILTVTKSDLVVILIGAALVIALLVLRWTSLLIATTNQDLAYASGVNPKREQLVLNLAIAIVIAVSIQVVGALLISAFLIIPAATARNLSRSPEAMAVVATFTAIVAGLGGLAASYQFDTQTGPTIVSVSAILFIAATIWAALRRSA